MLVTVKVGIGLRFFKRFLRSFRSL